MQDSAVEQLKTEISNETELKGTIDALYVLNANKVSSLNYHVYMSSTLFQANLLHKARDFTSNMTQSNMNMGI